MSEGIRPADTTELFLDDGPSLFEVKAPSHDRQDCLEI